MYETYTVEKMFSDKQASKDATNAELCDMHPSFQLHKLHNFRKHSIS